MRIIVLTAALIASAALFSGPARSAEFIVLSNAGRTLSKVDSVKSKVVKSIDIAAENPLVTVAVNSVEGEIWGITDDNRLKRFNYKNLAPISESAPIDLGPYQGKIIYCVDDSVYCNVIINKKSVSALNEEGTVLLTADLPKAAYRSGLPRLIGFGAVVVPGDTTSSKLFAVDGDDDSLIRLPPTNDNPKWILVGAIEKPVNKPLAFDIVREAGVTQGFAVLGATLYALNLKNAKLTKPKAVKGLKGDAQAISFYVPSAVPSAQ